MNEDVVLEDGVLQLSFRVEGIHVNCYFSYVGHPIQDEYLVGSMVARPCEFDDTLYPRFKQLMRENMRIAIRESQADKA